MEGGSLGERSTLQKKVIGEKERRGGPNSLEKFIRGGILGLASKLGARMVSSKGKGEGRGDKFQRGGGGGGQSEIKGIVSVGEKAWGPNLTIQKQITSIAKGEKDPYHPLEK